MVAVVLYAVIASTAMILIARSFVRVAEDKNQAEAEYRYALTRLRENGESIALLGGQDEELTVLREKLRAVITRWARLGGQHMRTTLVSNSNYLIAPVIPILLCAPKYLDGSMSLGQVMQAAAAFVQVQTAFNWLVDNYPRLADWAASARRVAGLIATLDKLDEIERSGAKTIERKETDDVAVRLHGLSVTLSDGKTVVDDADAQIQPGEKVLVVGQSGSGKSTLVRAISGLWPWGEGEVHIKRGARLFMMPQKPYVPLGTLRRAISYPAPAEDFGDEAVKAAMKNVGLEHLIEKLDEEEPWDKVLSGGEQQRLAFVRVFLHQPDIIVMDEATSALDTEGQEKLMVALYTEMPETTVISVGHRAELEGYHERKLTLERRDGGAQLVKDQPLPPSTGLIGVLLERLAAAGRAQTSRRRANPPPVRPSAPAGDQAQRITAAFLRYCALVPGVAVPPGVDGRIACPGLDRPGGSPGVDGVVAGLGSIEATARAVFPGIDGIVGGPGIDGPRARRDARGRALRIRARGRMPGIRTHCVQPHQGGDGQKRAQQQQHQGAGPAAALNPFDAHRLILAVWIGHVGLRRSVMLNVGGNGRVP